MLAFLQLLHLADSALPIGALSHSLGLESLTAELHVTPDNLAEYIRGLLSESMLVDAVYCRTAYHAVGDPIGLRLLNQRLSAMRVAREMRSASLTLGRRFLTLTAELQNSEMLDAALKLEEMHWPVAFGVVGGALHFGVENTVAALLHQGVLNTISTAQRLIALGQREASHIAWQLKLPILAAVKKSDKLKPEEVFCFSHLPELASMRHPNLPTRLFIS